MSFTLGHFAGNMFAASSKRLQVISAAAQNSDVFTLSEVLKDHGPVRALLEFDDHTRGELSIGWRHAKFTSHAAGNRTVMLGGKRGAGIRALDKRRRGPSRAVIWVLLTEKHTGKRLIVATHHAIAKADTQHKWRRPLRAQGFRGVAAELTAVRRRFPDAGLVLTGDFNTVGRIAFAISGIRQVSTPATFGRLKYDRIFAARTSVSNVRTLRTKSDHRALLATVTLTGDATPTPVPPKPPEVPVARQAKSLDVLLAEVNRLAPNRSKASDGGLGDQAHASRTSDHNPNSAGVWRARDFTHDPKGGCDADVLAREVAAMLGKHPALGSGAYVIRNRRVISTNRLSEGWRTYTGSNPHDKHVHVSVATAASGYDSTKPWGVAVKAAPPENHVQKGRRLITEGVAELRKAAKTRKAVHRMADAIEEAASKGPAR